MNDDLILVLDDSLPLGLVIEDSSSPFTLTIGDGETEYPVYEGETVFTPTRQTQTVVTSRKVVLDNITINPIPRNYGLVTYNGSIITIT